MAAIMWDKFGYRSGERPTLPDIRDLVALSPHGLISGFVIELLKSNLPSGIFDVHLTRYPARFLRHQQWKNIVLGFISLSGGSLSRSWRYLWSGVGSHRFIVPARQRSSYVTLYLWTPTNACSWTCPNEIPWRRPAAECSIDCLAISPGPSL